MFIRTKTNFRKKDSKWSINVGELPNQKSNREVLLALDSNFGFVMNKKFVLQTDIKYFLKYTKVNGNIEELIVLIPNYVSQDKVNGVIMKLDENMLAFFTSLALKYEGDEQDV